MIEDRNSSKLYWQGGPFRLAINYPLNISQSTVVKAMKILEKFRDECHKLSIIFDIAQGGKHKWLNEYKNVLEQGNDNTIFFGTIAPGAHQSRGQSITSQTSMRHLLENLKPGGEFESQLSKMIVVFIFNLWDDNFRDKIARLFPISKNLVECDLMGDIRLIRNSIIHTDSVIRLTDLERLRLLRHIWPIEPGKLIISSNMIHALMEQINAMCIRIKSNS